MRLEGMRPKVNEQDTGQVASFMSTVDRSPTLRSLSGLPFYCWVLLEQFRDGSLKEFSDDVAMLDYLIERMVKREIDKGLLDLRLFEADGLEDWLEQIAINYVEDRRYSDIDRNEVVEYGRLVLADGVDEKTQNHILTTLLQFPLFCAGTDSGRVTFAHDLIAQALAAKAYFRRLSRLPAEVGRRLSHVDLDDPTLLRFIASKMGEQEEEAVVRELQRGSLNGHGFGALLSLVMLAHRSEILSGGFSRSLRPGFKGGSISKAGSTRRVVPTGRLVFCDIPGVRS
jgi:hypothetical protein